MYLTSYWGVLLFVPGILAIIFSLRRRGYTRGQTLGIACLRGLMLLVLVLLLTDLHVSVRDTRRHHVFLIDVSDSFRPNRDTADEFTRNQITRIPSNERVTVIAFAGKAAITWQGVGGTPPQSVLSEPGLSDADRTDLASALDQAQSVLAPTENGIFYLISDGLLTEPLDPDALKRPGMKRIILNALVTRPGWTSDLRILLADAPEIVTPQTPFNINALLFSETTVAATLHLAGPETNISTPVELRAGVPTFVILSALSPNSGLGTYVVSVEGSPDPVPENNRLHLATLAKSKPEILVLGRPSGAVETIARATLAPFSVRNLSPTSERPLRLDPAELAETALVVIDDLPADAFTPAAIETLTRFVQYRGGGLLMLGGTRSFGSGGWAGSELESVLPVWCDPRDADKQPLGLVLVMDASGSMSQGQPPKVELARRAVLNAVTALKEQDLVGVTVFRMQPQVLVPLGSPAPLDPIREAVMRVGASGGTNMYPALLTSIAQLARIDKPLRHILLVSDGRSQPGNIEDVLAALKAEKITLSAVMTGADADREALARLARESGGRFYEVRQMSELSRVFLDDLRRVEGPLMRTGQSFPVRSAGPGKNVSGTILGYNRVRPKSTGTILYDTVIKQDDEDRIEPILVVGQAGLGHAAGLMTAPGTEWTGPAQNWTDLSRTLTELLGNLARNENISDYRITVRSASPAASFTVEAEHEGIPINDKQLQLTLQSGRKSPQVLPLEQTAPGTYVAETRLAPDETGILVLSEPATGHVLGTRVIATPYPAEYLRSQPDLDGLAQLARTTGGTLFTRPEEVSQYVATPARHHESARTPLLLVLLALFVTEAGLRALGRI